MEKSFYIKRVLPFLEKGAEAALCTYIFLIPFSHVATLMSFAIILFPSLIIFKILIEKKFSGYNTPLTVPLFLFASTAKRFNATFGRYNTAGMYSVIFIPTLFSLFLWYKKLWNKVLLGISLSASLLGVLFTQARAAWVCLFPVTILIGFILDKRILAFALVSFAVTSTMLGGFRRPETRAEFMNLIK